MKVHIGLNTRKMMLTSAKPQGMRWVLAERVLPRRQRHSKVKKHKERRRQKNFGRLCISHSSHSCAWLSLELVQGRGLWWHVCSCNPLKRHAITWNVHGMARLMPLVLTKCQT